MSVQGICVISLLPIVKWATTSQVRKQGTSKELTSADSIKELKIKRQKKGEYF